MAEKTSGKSKKPMVWTQEHNDDLIAEMYHHEPYKFKRGSKSRGTVWDQISLSLNNLQSPKFAVTQKSVRDHYNLLEKEQRQRIREEEKATGISPGHSEFEEHMEDLIQRFDEKDSEEQQADVDRKEKAEAETAKAVQMRKMSMETMSQTKNRKGVDDLEPKKSKRTSSSETVSYLREKAAIDAELKKEELRVREEELKNSRRQQEQLMQQMQNQNTALMALIQGMSKK